ncbi:MAG: cupin domain-containing protein [Cyanobacteria bacterium P01_F01_bin.143]
MPNIFNLPLSVSNQELFETLFSGNDILIERIISTGQTTPSGEWYDQDQDEWVILLQGEASLDYDDGSQIKLIAGDYLLISAHQKHRVTYTSSTPPCIWLAIHANLVELINKSVS